MEYPQRQADHLQILASRRGGDHPWLGADVEDDCAVQPWNEKVRTLVNDCVLDSGQTVEDDRPRATLDVVERGLGRCKGQGTRACEEGEAELGCSHRMTQAALMFAGK